MDTDSETEASDPLELPFPPYASTVDASAFVRQAIMAAVPAEPLCGREDCVAAPLAGLEQQQAEAAKADRLAPPAKPQQGTAGAFAALAKLKRQADGKDP